MMMLNEMFFQKGGGIIKDFQDRKGFLAKQGYQVIEMKRLTEGNV